METPEILDIKKMKEISHQIIDEELKNSNVKYKVYPVTFIEYCKDYIFNNKHKLKKIGMPLRAGGFCEFNGDIVIFLNQINKIERVENKIFTLVRLCYHETRHVIQKKFNCYSYEGFLYEIDEFLKTDLDYSLEHDKYSFEIGANLYSVKKAKEYLIKNYPNIYERQKNEIEQLEKKYQLDYMKYDVTDTVERTIKQLRRAIKNKDKKTIINRKPVLERVINKNWLSNISPVLEMFLNKDASFKNFSEIIQEPRFKDLDKRIVYAFLSSKSFLQQINMNQLSLEELEIINEALQYTSNLYKKQINLLEKELDEKNIAYLEYLRTESSLLKKITTIEIHYGRKILDYLDLTRKRENMKNIPAYLEENTQLITQRKNKGYLTIAMLYIISIVIIISSILFVISIN